MRGSEDRYPGDDNYGRPGQCPRCGETGRKLLSLSRIDNQTMICDPCGTAEAMEEYTEWERKQNEDKTK